MLIKDFLGHHLCKKKKHIYVLKNNKKKKIYLFLYVVSKIVYYCQTPDQTKIKIRSNQKSGEAL